MNRSLAASTIKGRQSDETTYTDVDVADLLKQHYDDRYYIEPIRATGGPFLPISNKENPETGSNLLPLSDALPDDLSQRLSKKAHQIVSDNALQRWDGYVVAICGDNFVARLTDLTNGGQPDGEEAEIPLDELDDEDRAAIAPGKIFFWTIGYERTAGGPKKACFKNQIQAATTMDSQANRERAHRGPESLEGHFLGLASTAPSPDQIEVTLIGPGYGECIIFHLGGGRWGVIDSCIDSVSSEPAALRYLSSIGVSRTDVVLVIATHWHDDHIRGLAKIVEACTNASFCSSLAWGKEEFIAMVSSYNDALFARCTSGVREAHKIFDILKRRTRPKGAVSDRLIFNLPSTQSGHGHVCRITTLSPSDKQIEGFYREIALLMPTLKGTITRCAAHRPNHSAVVASIEIGSESILLGSDLEETGDPETGWSVIVASSTRPRTRSRIFKVFHHGSNNAHNADVWTQMLEQSPIAILTPYNRGSRLPSTGDVNRIVSLAPDLYSTSRPNKPRVRNSNSTVEKTLREAGVRITKSEPQNGLVRLRNGGATAFQSWSVELSIGACHLEKFFD